ncbi:MAG: hypothetical protein H8E44_33340 [Planctomycetes bacterium]|nr:hypothetical protein [Planctomycetota bacterium]MBL7037371.1 hypothetical protein [Pirellulaceae bacterium]
MSETFDPYYRWLGIPLKEQPPHHYRLLGIELFESDRHVIDSVASRHMSYLQDITDGPHVKEAQQLLNELSAARRCLLEPQRKAAYDAELETKLAAQSKPPKAASPARRQRIEKPSPAPPPPKMSQETPAAGAASQRKPWVAAKGDSKRQERLGPATERRNKKPMYLIAGGAAAGLVVLLVAVGMLHSGGDGGETKTRQTQGKQKQARPVVQTAERPKPPISVGTQSSPDDVVAKADLDTSPLPDVRVEEAEETEDVPIGRQSKEGPSAAFMTSDGLPAQVDSLLLWLDASDESSTKTGDDARVSVWNDKSGKDCHATVDSADGGPELVQDVLGGRPIARFSGSQCFEIKGKSELFKTDSEYTFLFVARGHSGTLLSKGSGDSAGSFAMRDGVASFCAKGTHLDAENDDGSDFRVRTIMADKNALSWHVDGQPSGTFSTADCAIHSASVVRIGALQKRGKGLQEFLEGEVAELLVYSRPLADDERQSIEAYLQDKWLSEGTPPLAKTETPPSKEAGEDAGEPDPAATVASSEVENAGLPKNDEVIPPHKKEFVVLIPVEAEASAGSDLEVLDNGTILADGSSKSDEAYRITAQTEISGMTALCLEALPHDSLPGKGPGHGLGGRFSLAEFKVSVRPKDESGPAREVSFSRVLADDDTGVERLIDGDEKTSWSVRRRGQRVAVTLIPTEPIGGEGTALLTVTMQNGDNLGCFRLLATSMPDPETPPASSGTQDGDRDDRFTLFVNLAGDAWDDPDGNTWLKSKDFDGATFGHEGGQSIKKDDVENPVAKTAQRGLTAFRAVVPNGVYEVQLYFAEHWTTDPKRRMFAVFAEQKPVRRPQNIFLAPGMGSPYIHLIPRVAVTDGRLDVDFSPANEDALSILNGISIRQIR